MSSIEELQRKADMQEAALSLWEQFFEPIGLLSNLPGQKSKMHQKSIEYLKHGAARRLRMIYDTMRWITMHAGADRKTQLSMEEQNRLDTQLNSLYLHIRGTLDNYGWAIIWQLAPKEAQKLEETQAYQRIGLFSSSVLSKLNGDKLKDVIEGYLDWSRDLSRRRDPVAHRIPIFYARIMNSGETAEYSQVINQMYEAMGRLDLVKAEQCRRQANELGVFSGMFGHSMQDILPIYPTITGDCYNLIEITNSIIDFLKERKLIHI